MSELSELQAAEIAKLQALGKAWHQFHHGASDELVPTDAASPKAVLLKLLNGALTSWWVAFWQSGG